ncbi:hypothetical protein GGR52DRAFT_573276 [Hypoxylon sp. FL1284]|nr:hypothetical protein GGR52DRAFT_573276 [Hypoxylon sp. FL1284]
MTGLLVFRARYADETSLYEQLRKIFPMGSIQIRFQRGRFYCTIPRALTPVWLDPSYPHDSVDDELTI